MNYTRYVAYISKCGLQHCHRAAVFLCAVSGVTWQLRVPLVVLKYIPESKNGELK